MDLKPVYKPEHRIIINEFIRTKFQETGVGGVILGLSGGLDSAVVAALATEVIGKDKVHCILMPYDEEQDKEAIEDGLKMVKAFGLDHQIISIKDSVDTISEVAGFSDIQKKVNMTALGNVRARTRMVMLYYLANLNNYLVLGTSNKSELLVGYFTKYGDGGSDAAPIGDLYKTQVYELAKELGIPESIRTKPPTAGLVSGQTDEKDLGLSYAELDQILKGLELWLCLEDISRYTKIPLSTVTRIQAMVHRSAHKRFLGMIPKIGIRTPGLDWRENVSLLSLFHEPLDG
jgi:NAD+ synthase